jgi:uncharacterized 2Fe-2S/4Fe-4S cluster protein (DUF4445 family)
MRAATGAIAAVELRESGEFHYEVLGGGAPRGICGSGLVDVAATALDAGGLLTNGRLVHGALRLTETVVITQPDIRELQLAKAAIAAGLEILLAKLGLALPDLARIYLAGAFGNYVNVRSARRIGLLDMDESRIVAAGNTSLLGVKMALFQDDLHFGELRRRIEHVPLRSDPEFQERYVGSMQFPG